MSIGTPLHTWKILCVLKGETPQHIFGGPGHILILMGVLLIHAFRLCILGLSYQRVIGLIGCGPGIMVFFFLLPKQQRIGTCFDCMHFPKGWNKYSFFVFP